MALEEIKTIYAPADGYTCSLSLHRNSSHQRKFQSVENHGTGIAVPKANRSIEEWTSNEEFPSIKPKCGRLNEFKPETNGIDRS